MRTENQVIEQILSYAKDNDDIRAVELNGSRADSNTKKDIFQDYDVVYYVSDFDKYVDNKDLMDYFGKIIIKQTAKEQFSYDPDKENWYIYLMIFEDGVRIDLSIKDANTAELPSEGMYKVLLDKDGMFKDLPKSTDEEFYPSKPSNKAFICSCNNFWWVSTYVVKAIYREQFIAANEIYSRYVRGEVHKMLGWYFGIKSDFSKSPGKFFKNYKGVIKDEHMKLFNDTYRLSNYEDIYTSLFTLCDLMSYFAKEVASYFNYEYNQVDEDNVRKYLLHIKDLPKDAKEIY